MNDLYGIFKKNSSDNHYVSFAKSLNSPIRQSIQERA